MKFFPIFSIVLMSQMASADTQTQCDATALDVASYIDQSGWGIGPEESIAVASAKAGNQGETIVVKSSVSGYTYTMSMVQDAQTESCVTTQISIKN